MFVLTHGESQIYPDANHVYQFVISGKFANVNAEFL